MAVPKAVLKAPSPVARRSRRREGSPARGFSMTSKTRRDPARDRVVCRPRFAPPWGAVVNWAGLRRDTTAMSAPCQLAAIRCRSVQALTRHSPPLRNRIVQTIFMEGGSMTGIEPLP
jgi:hypothetical protein